MKDYVTPLPPRIQDPPDTEADGAVEDVHANPEDNNITFEPYGDHTEKDSHATYAIDLSQSILRNMDCISLFPGPSPSPPTHILASNNSDDNNVHELNLSSKYTHIFFNFRPLLYEK